MRSGASVAASASHFRANSVSPLPPSGTVIAIHQVVEPIGAELGGAVFVLSDPDDAEEMGFATFASCDFVDNIASKGGGAIATVGSVLVHADDTVVSGNMAVLGGVAFVGDGNQPNFTAIETCSFTRNQARIFSFVAVRALFSLLPVGLCMKRDHHIS